jgi:LCP family protein required for cell wall assembly
VIGVGGTRFRLAGPAVVLLAALAAGCNSTGTADTTTTTRPPTTTTTAPPTTTTTTRPPTTTSTSTTTVPTTTTTTLPEGFPAEGRVNILLMGGDSGVGRRGIRTDTMIVISIDPATGWIAMFGIPRNLWGLPLPPGHSAQGSFECGDCFGAIANEIYPWGLTRPDLFGEENPGAAAAKDLLGYLLGIDIHYFALVDLAQFVEVIDAIGGVDIEVLYPIHDDEYPNVDGTYSVKDQAPGIYHMNGTQALYYARSRHATDDFNRMGRQRCVLQAVAQQSSPLALLGRFDTIKESVLTDLPDSAILYLIDLLPEVNTDEIVSIRFMPDAPEFAGTPTSYIADWTADRYPIPNRDFIAQTVATALSLPPAEAIATLNLQPLAAVCGDPQP